MNGFCLLLHPYNNSLSCRAFDRSCILPCISTFTSVCLSAAAVCAHVLCCLPLQLCFFLNLPMTEALRCEAQQRGMGSVKNLHAGVITTSTNTNGSQIGFVLIWGWNVTSILRMFSTATADKHIFYHSLWLIRVCSI